MKNSILLVAVFLITATAMFAQPPQKFNYQAVVRDNTGAVLANQTVSIRVSIHSSSASGTIIYQETFSPTTNQFGLVNLEIGTGTPTIGDFTTINWRYYAKFLELECDPSGGSNYASMGTTELSSVPYALFSSSSADSYWQSLVAGKICYNNGLVGIGTDDPGDLLELSGGALRLRLDDTYPTVYGEILHEGSAGFKLNAAAGGTWADMHFQTNGTTKMFLESAGNLGIGTTSPSARLTVKSSGYTGGMYVLADDDERIFRIRQMSGGGGGIYAFDGSDNATIQLNGEGSSYISSGYLGINTTTPNAYLHVNDRIRVGEDPSYGSVYGELIHEGGGNGFKINANAGGSWADMHLQTDGNTRMFIESGGNVGIGTTSPSSKLDVRGNITIRSATTGNIVMELGTGLDYAEGFNVSDKNGVVAGTILCIDPANPGKLVISKEPYDKKVAGIVAGANGLGSGIKLGVDQFDYDVALAGRVYCNVEASKEKIEPGDLLTTSSIPGYAMKVSNVDEAQGAILGKAMESLDKGERGQILVLVTLQ